MRLIENQLDDVPLVQVIGEVDHATAPALRASIDAALAQGGSCLLLDLEACPYLDSGGVSVLLDTLRRVRPDGWLGVVGPTPDVFRILSLVGFAVDPHFRVFASLDEARAALSDR
jgi:anti-anti-sigma factor